MGKVRTIGNTGQMGEETSNTSLEITYGGDESPFGGVHYGPPPAYIDPKCFTDSNGFMVIDNKLVAMSLEPFVLPTLWNSTAGVVLLKLGTFYNSIFGQLNYALGYAVSNIVVNGVNGVQIDFYITAWNYNNVGVPTIVDNEILTLTRFTVNIEAIAATLTIPVVMGESADYSDSGQLGLSYGASAVVAGALAFGYTPGMKISDVVTGIVAVINAASGSTLFTAAPSADGLSVVLTAVTPGVAGNNLFIQDDSFSTTPNNPSAFYFVAPITGATKYANLQGGTNAVILAPATSISGVSTIDVGGTLYISGLKTYPWVLKYAGPGTFTISSAYQGLQILKKFAGSLIGIGLINQLLNQTKNQDMIFSWSAAEDLDEWSPIDASGNVTGAGFSQLADIGDVLTGLIVSNNVAYIIRSQGLSYATALGSGQNPFQFAHIGLGHVGEGSQIAALIGDYDQTGVYVGQTNVFQLSGSISAIGDKVKSKLFPLVNQASAFGKVIISPTTQGGDTYSIAMVILGANLFLYNTANQTWMSFGQTLPGTFKSPNADVLFNQTSNSNVFDKFPAVISYQPNTGVVPVAFALDEGMIQADSLSAGPAFITFPIEEVLFGREVTIDALYISLWADLVDASITINFFFNGIAFSSLLLQSGAPFNTIGGAPVELQVFPNNVALAGTGVFTAKSPQLSIQVPATGSSNVNLLRFAKIQMYASFDPSQRPV